MLWRWVIAGLWVEVVRLEAQESYGVSDIKRDMSSGGGMYCLRRNALGYGLYEIGVENLDGPLVTLSEDLTTELRSDAQRATVDRQDDVSLTWKILGAADSLSSWMERLGPSPAGAGVTEDLKSTMRRRPDDVFETKQREQLRAAAASLKSACIKLLEARPTDCASSFPRDLRPRFARLRAALFEAATSVPVVRSSECPESAETPYGSGEVPEFIEVLAHIEKTGGWLEMSSGLRSEVIAFSRHAREIESHALELAKGRHIELGFRPKPQQAALPVTVPLLPPPPSGTSSACPTLFF